MNDNQEILTRAIEKAIAAGWKFENNSVSFHIYNDALGFPSVRVMQDKFSVFGELDYQRVIYDHDFAKALWGGQDNVYDYRYGAEKMWQFHLQQMVIAEDPFQYLKENI